MAFSRAPPTPSCRPALIWLLSLAYQPVQSQQPLTAETLLVTAFSTALAIEVSL